MGIRDEILARTNEPLKLVPVKFMGADVFMREMNAAERDDYEAEQAQRNLKGTALQNFRARLLVRVLCDENRAAIFQPEDADKLGQLPPREVHRVFNRAAKLNAMTPEDIADLEKNS